MTVSVNMSMEQEYYNGGLSPTGLMPRHGRKDHGSMLDLSKDDGDVNQNKNVITENDKESNKNIYNTLFIAQCSMYLDNKRHLAFKLNASALKYI